VVKLKTNNYQNLPWNNTIEEDTIRYSDLFAGGKGINVWPIVKILSGFRPPLNEILPCNVTIYHKKRIT
jgi:hypothetical protein